MMTDHEEMMVSAERYALGRKTYIVDFTCRYIAEHIEGMSDHCKRVLIEDIEHPIGGYGDECDKAGWMWLLERLREDTE